MLGHVRIHCSASGRIAKLGRRRRSEASWHGLWRSDSKGTGLGGGMTGVVDVRSGCALGKDRQECASRVSRLSMGRAFLDGLNLPAARSRRLSGPRKRTANLRTLHDQTFTNFTSIREYSSSGRKFTCWSDASLPLSNSLCLSLSLSRSLSLPLALSLAFLAFLHLSLLRGRNEHDCASLGKSPCISSQREARRTEPQEEEGPQRVREAAAAGQEGAAWLSTSES